MKKREFKKQMGVCTPNELLKKFMFGEIFLTEKQLDEVIAKKQGTPEEGHGRVIKNV